MSEDETDSEDATFALNDVCGHEIRCFSVAEDAPTLRIRCVDALSPADSLLLSQDGQASTDLTGHCIWASARIAALLIQRRHLRLFPNTTTLELGAGTGFWGISAATAFSVGDAQEMSVILTDGTDSAVKLLKENVVENRLSSSGNCSGIRVEVARLEWGNLADISAIGKRFIGGIDYCFATDCIYDMSVLPALLSTAYMLLRGSEGEGVRVTDRHVMRQRSITVNRDIGKQCFVICNVMNRMMDPDLPGVDRRVVEAAADVGFSEYCIVEEAVEMLGKEGLLRLDRKVAKAIDGLHVPLFCFWV